MYDRRTVLIGTAAFPTIVQAKSVARNRTVVTTLGPVRGSIEQGLHIFRGIRYGSAERFRAPRPLPPSREVIDAVAFGPSAPQAGGKYGPHSEDCLTLNVWTPEASRGARLPVMVYFHGGAYSTGSVADPLNDGRHLAARGVVVVTVNHRLNALGYIYLARLDPRFPDSGNAGQLDLILALQWIRDNIAAFGGDPNRIMVFGQSGGGAKIATLMGMPAAAELFHRAATMSGQQVTASGPLNATKRAQAYLARLKATPADLAAMPLDRLIEALATPDPVMGGNVYFGPVLDMKWLARHPFWPDANPQSNAIPMILGNTRDETRAFFGPDHPKIVGLNWDNLAERLGPELKVDISPEWVVAEYRKLFPTDAPEEIFFKATTAGRSWRGQVEEAEARARADAPTWVYQLDFASPVEPWRGAGHTLDVPLVFGTLDAPGSITGTGTAARAVSEAMMTAFTALARSGEAGWPQYRLPERSTMISDAPPHVENDPRREQRELFARVPYIQPGT
ncbi:MAG TPA: carboxylesterase/lipase family protein [Sphingomicrobium sp.]|nr:carboxylesterase/lipase family protein [Sphingomicrobium sp.]